MSSLQKRIFSPYELTQLAKNGYLITDQIIEQIGEMPVEYFTHQVDFCSLSFYVDERVLIPRIETEYLVTMAMAEVNSRNLPLNHQSAKGNDDSKLIIADVGTGSGAIITALAHQIKEGNLLGSCSFFASDLSAPALEVAVKNWHTHLQNFPVNFFTSNLLTEYSVKLLGKKIDLIIANLPYIPHDRIQTLDESVKNFEPHLALDGGKNGLSLIKKLLDQATSVITPSGCVLLELDYTHTQEELERLSPAWQVTVTTDDQLHNRYARCVLKK